MADVKWIKITTDMFDDEKIKLIQAMPEGDSILVIWIRLLTLAGKINNGGYVYLSDSIPYTDDMLSTVFNKSVQIIRLAMGTLSKMGMIEITGGIINIINFEKHQNIQAMELIKEHARLRQQRHRLALKEPDKTDVTLPSRDVTALDKSRVDIDKNKERYGEFKNVILSHEEYEKLKTKFPDFLDKIERLSEYISSKGKKYSSHYATILSWARKDPEKSAPVYKVVN